MKVCNRQRFSRLYHGKHKHTNIISFLFSRTSRDNHTVIHHALLLASAYCSLSSSLSQSPISSAITSACPALALIFVIFPRCAYSYTVRTSNARILSRLNGTRGWNCALPCSTKCFCSASCGEITDSMSSVSTSMLLRHEVA